MDGNQNKRVADFLAVVFIFGGIFGSIIVLAACAGVAYLVHNYATS